MIARERCEAAFRQALAMCDPAQLVRAELARLVMRPALAIAVGKAALAMARGAGQVTRGIAVAPVAGDVPAGWQLIVAAHPVPDERSVAAGAAVLELFRHADAPVLALISGGASALIEQPLVPLARFNAEIAALAARGATIHELNAARTQRSAIKGGKLAAVCPMPITTLAVSDVFDDDIAIIGSGPTIPCARAHVIAPMESFGRSVAAALQLPRIAQPLTTDVTEVADQLAAQTAATVAWGEPTVVVPADHGRGGRAQQLALELARRLRGTQRSAFVAGSDGIDGPTDAAGAYVDGTTWDRLRDPKTALARRDAYTTLAEIGALFTPGPTGINHADVMIIS